MAGLINMIGAGLSSAGGAVSQLGSDAATMQMKSDLEDQSMRLASSLRTQEAYAAPGAHEAVESAQLNLAKTKAQLASLGITLDDQGNVSQSGAPPSSGNAATPAQSSNQPGARSSGNDPVVVTGSAGKFPTLTVSQLPPGMSPATAKWLALNAPDKLGEAIAEWHKPHDVRPNSQVTTLNDEAGGIEPIYSNDTTQPLTDTGRLNADLKSGRINQDQYNSAISALTARQEKTEQNGRWTRFEDTASNRTGELNTATGEIRYDNAAPAGGINPKNLTESKMVEIDGANGERTQVLGQQDKSTGQWVSADEKHTPLEGVTLPGGVGGVRSQVMMGRVLSSAHTVANELENMVALPGNASAGTLGIPEGAGVLGSLKANLVRTVQPQEVQSAQVSMAGLSRALAQMESAGLAPGGALVGQMDRLTLQAGDSELTRLQKLATMRQTASGILDSMENQPAATAAQRKEIEGIKDRLAQAVPFEPIDVINLAKSKNPGETLGDIAKNRGLGAKQAGPPLVKTPADARKLPSNIPTFQTPDGRLLQNPNYTGAQ